MKRFPAIVIPPIEDARDRANRRVRPYVASAPTPDLAQTGILATFAGMSHTVVNSLKAKRAEVAGKVEHLEEELTQARRDLTYIDGALHVFGYGDDPAEIKAKRYRPTPRLFSRGELQRTVFDQLRRSPDGIDTTELTDRIMRQKGWDTHRHRSPLRRHAQDRQPAVEAPQARAGAR